MASSPRAGMSSSSSTRSVTQQELLYQTSSYCLQVAMKGLTQQVDDKKVGLHSQEAVMNLHQALAAVCVSATRRNESAPHGKEKYVITPQVVACHVDSEALEDTDKKRLALAVEFARNAAWQPTDKEHIAVLLTKLKAIQSSGRPHSAGDHQLVELIDHIYKYCDVKVWSNLGKLVVAMEAAVKTRFLPPAVVQHLATLQSFLRHSEDRALHSSRARTLARASAHCKRNILRSLVTPRDYDTMLQKTPRMIKRWRKMASYCASFDILVTWAVGEGGYARYKGKYLDAKQLTFLPAAGLNRNHTQMQVYDPSKAELEGHYKAAYKTEDIPRLIAELKPIVQATAAKAHLLVHAEMYMAPKLCHRAAGAGKHPQYIGVSKPCCFLCYQAILSLQGPTEIRVNGTHNKLYPHWMIPLDMCDPEVIGLQTRMHSTIFHVLSGGKTPLLPTADSDWLSGNPDDIRAVELALVAI